MYIYIYEAIFHVYVYKDIVSECFFYKLKVRDVLKNDCTKESSQFVFRFSMKVASGKYTVIDCVYLKLGTAHMSPLINVIPFPLYEILLRDRLFFNAFFTRACIIIRY